MKEKLSLKKARRKLMRKIIETPDTLENEQKLYLLYLQLDSVNKQLKELEEKEIIYERK